MRSALAEEAKPRKASEVADAIEFGTTPEFLDATEPAVAILRRIEREDGLAKAIYEAARGMTFPWETALEIKATEPERRSVAAQVDEARRIAGAVKAYLEGRDERR